MAIKIREYEDYDQYIEHQKEKTDDAIRRQRLAVSFPVREAYFTNRIRATVERMNLDPAGRLVCLGARMGEEVSAWKKFGFENSIGTDLIARPPYVVVEDFHNLSYGDETIDIFYTNSIDHSNDPAKMFSEVARCLKVGGYFIADFQFGHMGNYEACRIDNFEDVLNVTPDPLETVGKPRKVGTLSNPTTEVIFKKIAK
jgi:SAM-dependent methyltransferase